MGGISSDEMSPLVVEDEVPGALYAVGGEGEEEVTAAREEKKRVLKAEFDKIRAENPSLIPTSTEGSTGSGSGNVLQSPERQPPTDPAEKSRLRAELDKIRADPNAAPEMADGAGAGAGGGVAKEKSGGRP
jgi:hypothetical protein